VVMRRVRSDQGYGDLPPLGRPARTPPFVLRSHSVEDGEGSMHARPTIVALTDVLCVSRSTVSSPERRSHS